MSETVSTQEQAADMAAALRASKKELRQKIRKALSGLSQDSVYEQSNLVCERLLRMNEYKNAKRISVYLSMEGKEVQTPQIVEHALASGKKVFVPYLYKRQSDGSKLMDMLALESTQDYKSLQRDSWGIPSLAAESVSGRENSFGGHGLVGESEQQHQQHKLDEHNRLDLVVVPGVAFDQRLGRLGHGRGYYDRFMARCKESLGEQDREKGRMPFLVGLALREQILPADESVPRSSFDWPVDRVMTDDAEFGC